MLDLHAEKASAVEQCCHRVDVLETTVVRVLKPNRTERCSLYWLQLRTNGFSLSLHDVTEVSERLAADAPQGGAAE